jgi:hypothetical protein
MIARNNCSRSNEMSAHHRVKSPLTITEMRNFKHNVFMLDEVGELLEHLGGTEDYLLAAELYEVALKRWPMARIQMREAARIVYDNKRSVVV